MARKVRSHTGKHRVKTGAHHAAHKARHGHHAAHKARHGHRKKK